MKPMNVEGEVTNELVRNFDKQIYGTPCTSCVLVDDAPEKAVPVAGIA